MNKLDKKAEDRIRKKPDDPATLGPAARYMMERGNNDRAFELLTRAKNAQWAGNLSEALSLEEAAVKTDPADPMVYAQRGLILSQLGDTNGAVLDLSKVIAKGWKWALAFKIRADALFKAGKWKAALADAELAFRLDPSDAAGLSVDEFIDYL